MARRLFSLQYKIWILTMIVAIIPLIALGLISNGVSIKVLNEQIGQSNFNTTQQMTDQIDMLFTRMDDYSLNLWRDETFIECLKKAKNTKENAEVYRLTAQKVINSYQIFEDNIYSAYIEADNGLIYDTAGVKNTISPELKEELVKRSGGGVLIADEVVDFNGKRQKVFSFLRVLKNPDVLTENLGIIKINMKEETVAKVYQGMQLSESSQIYVITGENVILSSKTKEEIGTNLATEVFDAAKQTTKSGFFEHDYGKEVVTYVGLRWNGWKLVNIVPTSELNQGARMIQNTTVTAIVAAILLCFLVSVFVSYRILKPIRQLRESMKLIEGENFDVPIPIDGNDEIALLGSSYNRMIKKLKELIQEVYVMQIKQRDAEIAVLQEQINPHFLYNTLNTIYWMCRTEQANQSAEIVKQLSSLFRLSLNSGDLITTVEKEIEHLTYYLAIQEKRFEGLVTFRVDVSEDVLKSNTIKLVLQPLVENALIHGVEKKGDAGTIKVTGYRQDNDLYFAVEDDGIGADVDEINRILNDPKNKSDGFAISNVNDRIKIHCGEEYGLFYEAEPDKGTKVIVKQVFSVEVNDDQDTAS